METGQPTIPSALILALSTSPATGNASGEREPGTPSTFSANLASSQYLLSRENSPSPHRDSSLSIHHRMSGGATPKADTLALPPSPPLTVHRFPSPEPNDMRLDQQSPRDEDLHTPRVDRFSFDSSGPRRIEDHNRLVEGMDTAHSTFGGRGSRQSIEQHAGRQSPVSHLGQLTHASNFGGNGNEDLGNTALRSSEPILGQGAVGSAPVTDTAAPSELPHNNSAEGKRSSAKRLTPTFRDEDIAALEEEKERRRSGRSSRRFSREVPRTTLSTPIGEDDEADRQQGPKAGRRSSGSTHRLEFKTVDDTGSTNTPYPGYGSSVGHSDFGKKSWSQHHPQIPRSSYYVGPPPLGSAFGTSPMGEIGVHYPREIVRVERDYSAGELVQFYPTYPLEFEGRVNPTQFQESINQINEVMISAHSLRASAWEHVLGVATLYLSLLLFESHYSKEMRRLAALIDHLNATIYNPAGLNILWPRKSAFMFLEIEYY